MTGLDDNGHVVPVTMPPDVDDDVVVVDDERKAQMEAVRATLGHFFRYYVKTRNAPSVVRRIAIVCHLLGETDEVTQAEMARTLRISRQRVSQLTRAIKKQFRI